MILKLHIGAAICCTAHEGGLVTLCQCIFAFDCMTLGLALMPVQQVSFAACVLQSTVQNCTILAVISCQCILLMTA